ncbi:hypothetical protein ABT297_26975 [Dactylosporangium sp. NPDC000555]|uniref:hypothetical protein n=1 Tax=Dactylosporangium sp. NPDC000555 TaxID=3154260 RepID=UPI00332DFB4D
MLIAVTFVSRFGRYEAHDLTVAQVEQLRAALDAVIRVEPAEEVEGPRYMVAQASPRMDVAA